MVLHVVLHVGLDQTTLWRPSLEVFARRPVRSESRELVESVRHPHQRPKAGRVT